MLRRSRNIIAPSILSADFSRLGREIEAVEKAGADWIHIDVMDGHFVPNLTIGPPVIKAIRKCTNLPFDVHLMIKNPDKYIENFVEAGADWVVVHVEACLHIHRTIQQIKHLGVKAGVALNPGTPICMIEPILEELDMVLIMSVNPGFGGQKFIKSAISKVKKLRQMIDTNNLPTLIEVDGGVNENTIGELAECGVDVFVAGTAIFKGNYEQNIKELRKRLK